MSLEEEELQPKAEMLMLFFLEVLEDEKESIIEYVSAVHSCADS